MRAKGKVFKWLSAGFGVAAIVTWGSLLSCEKANIQPMRTDNDVMKTDQDVPVDVYQSDNICGNVVTKSLLIGKEPVGRVLIYNDPHYLYVDAIADEEHMLKNAFLYAGRRDELPLNMNGYISYQEFNHIKVTDRYLKAQRFRIPLSELEGKFALSFVVQTVRARSPIPAKPINAWAEGASDGDDSFGMSFGFKKTVCMQIDEKPLDESPVE